MRNYFASNQAASFFAIIVSVFFVVATVQAATTISTNISTGGTLTVTGESYLTGNVGIGTTTPWGKLAVSTASQQDGSIPLFNVASTTNSSIFTVLSSGNVGIQTSNPNVALDVRGSTDDYATRVETGGNLTIARTRSGGLNFSGFNLGWINFGGTTDSYSTVGTGAQISSLTDVNGWSTGVSTPGRLVFSTTPANSTSVVERMRITSTGLVGIGVTPSNQLDIALSAEATAKTAAFSTLNIANTATSTTNSINKTGLQIASTGSWTGTSASNIGLYVSSVTGGTNNYDAIFNGGGSVGIGVSSPTSLFQVATSSSNATSSVEIGKTGQNKGSCLVMYDAVGTVQYVSIQGGAFVISASSCK